MESVEHGIKQYFFKNQIVAALLVVLLGWFLLQIKEILIMFFIAYILMAALMPYVRIINRHRIPKAAAAGIVYLITLSLVVLLVVPIVPFFVSQMHSLLLNLPVFIDGVSKLFGFHLEASHLQDYATSQLGSISAGAVAITTQAFSVIFSLILVFVLSFYLMIDQTRVKRELLGLFPKKQEQKIVDIIDQVEDKLGAWFRGQITLCIFIGFLTWVVLTAIGLPFALPLAIFAGILEIIPTLGPILSAVPAVIVALSISPLMALIVVVAYIIIQMLENNLLVPKIMQRAVGLNPIIIILAITIGANLLGILGALLAIPFIAMVIIIVKGIRQKNA